jgi:hypothetical protein
VEATGQMLNNLKMVAADKTVTFQLKYCSCGVKQHPRTSSSIDAYVLFYLKYFNIVLPFLQRRRHFIDV